MSTHLPPIPEDVQDSVHEWRKTYGKVILVSVKSEEEEEVLIFRPPTRSDTKALLQGSEFNPVEAEHLFIEGMILYPKGYDFGQLSDKDFLSILEALWNTDAFSDHIKFVNALNNKRAQLQENVDKVIDAFICAAFHVAPDYVDTLTSDQIIDHIALAEIILGRELPIQVRGQVSAERVDPAMAAEIAKWQRLQKRRGQRSRAWSERTGLPPDEPEVDEDTGRAIVNTSRENKAIIDAFPEARRHLFGR